MDQGQTGPVLGAEQRRARSRLFVGRERELEAFRNLLASGDTSRLVYVHGPGGIGKSSLLEEFRKLAEGATIDSAHLDARRLQATPDAISEAVQQTVAALDEKLGGLRILTLDHAEQWAALDGWVRSELLPSLPGDLILVLASREAPGPAWRADPGLNEFLTIHELTPLAQADAEAYLAHRDVDAEQQPAILDFARGRPLALALATDQAIRHPNRGFIATESPDLLQSLMSWLLRDLDDPHHQQAVAACATVRCLNQSLLAAMLDKDDATTEFGWLADQHFVEQHSDGLVIHDLVRDVVIRDLRSRDFGHHHSLIRRAMYHLLSGTETAPAQSSFQAMADCVYLMRDEPYAQQQWRFGDVACYPDDARADELPALAAEVEKLEGAESRSWFEYWSNNRCHELVVLRDRFQAPVAICLFIRMHIADIAASHKDPCVGALSRHLDTHAPLRGNENVLLARFLLAHGTHQARTPTAAEMAGQMLARLFTPGISLLCFVADQAYDWPGPAEDVDPLLFQDTDYVMGGHRYRIGGYDLRREPPTMCAYNMFDRILSGGATRESTPVALVLLQKDAFTNAVRNALQHFQDDSALAQSPLLRAPMLRRHAARQDVDTLRTLLRQTSADQLGGGLPRGITHELLELTYFQSATKQQATAAELHISERTLRRRVRQAEERLANSLWRLDTQIDH